MGPPMYPPTTAPWAPDRRPNPVRGSAGRHKGACYEGRVLDIPLVGRTVLVGGGARSGKSAFALAHARGLGARRAFVATAEALDEEMRVRIDRHRDERGGAFVTVEAPRDLPGALAKLSDVDVAVVDCLTLWLSNLLVAGAAASAIEEQLDGLVAVLARRRFHTVLVTNEVGMGLVPETPLGRAFRDLTGRAHQRLARVADEIFLAALGVILRLHPAPVERVSWETP
jgi:adenosylcobinamide kinase / adenosylcobinamide-phosphate guanylyltransferase